MAGKTRTPPVDQDQLINDIVDLILQGFKTRDIYKFTTAEYGIAKRTADTYIKKARAQFHQIDKKKKGQLRSKYRTRLENMYNDALVVKKDVRLALDIQKELNKLVEASNEEQTMPDVRVVFQYETDDNDKK